MARRSILLSVAFAIAALGTAMIIMYVQGIDARAAEGQSRVAGFVNPGSQVAIFASADPEIYKADGTTQKLSPYTRILLPSVEVIGVGDTTMTPRTTTSGDGKETTTEQIPRTILTLAVTQDQAERVIYASRNGDLSFALR